MRNGGFLIESTADRILFARREQLAARRAGNKDAEEFWAEAIDRLLGIYMEELEAFNADS